MINTEQLLSLLRTLLKIAGTAVVAHGTLGINGAMWEQISGAILMIAPVFWDMYSHTDDKALKVVEAMPDVKKIVVDAAAPPDGAAAVVADPGRPKVTSS